MVAPAVAMGIMGGLGALGGGKAGSKPKVQHTNETSTRSPWGPTTGPLRDIIQYAGGLFNNYWPAYPEAKPPKFHPSQQTKEGLGSLFDYGQQGSEFGNQAQDWLSGVLGTGGHLGGLLGQFQEGSPYGNQWNALTQLGTGELFQNALPGYQNVLGFLNGPLQGQQKSGGILDQLFGAVGGGGLGLTPDTSGYYKQIADHFLGEGGIGLEALFGSPGGSKPFEGMHNGRIYVASQLPGGGGGGNPGDNPYFEKYQDALENEMLETYQRSIVPQIDAEYQRAGRFGSGAYQLAQARANEEINEAIGNETSKLLYQMYERQMSQPQANAGSGLAAMLNARDQREQANKQMQISSLFQALSGLGGLEQFGIGTGMQGLGLLSGQEQFGLGLGMDALSGIAGLEQFGANYGLNALGGADQSALNYLLGGADVASGMNQFDLNSIAQGMGIDQTQLGALGQALGTSLGIDQSFYNSLMPGWQNQFNEQQYYANLPYQMLGQYMNTILPIATQFGTQTTRGTSSQPGVGFLPGAIQGGIGGAMAGKGFAGGGRPPTFNIPGMGGGWTYAN